MTNFKSNCKFIFSQKPSRNLIIFTNKNEEIILMKEKEVWSFVNGDTIKNNPHEILEIGTLNDEVCGVISVENIDFLEGSNFQAFPVRVALQHLTLEEKDALYRALGLIIWYNKNKFCAECGNKLENSTTEIAKICTECKNLFFPVISPAIIVAIYKGDQILLAHNKKFRDKLYGLIAGFVEVGENLEECVAREIYEEVRLKVKNIKYFSSQSWPFPNSLMFGFTAEYESGEITPDMNEIVDANWFSVKNLPQIPSNGSIARRLIDDFLQKQA